MNPILSYFYAKIKRCHFEFYFEFFLFLTINKSEYKRFEKKIYVKTNFTSCGNVKTAKY